MKNIGVIILFAFIGGFIGLMTASGEMSYTKKSQREKIFPYAAIIGLVAGAFIGAGIGNSSLFEDDSKSLGLDEIKRFEGKNGRKWYFETTWINPKTNYKNSIKTFYSSNTSSIVTDLNGKLQIVHNTSDGSKNYVEKTHYADFLIIKKRIVKQELTIQ